MKLDLNIFPFKVFMTSYDFKSIKLSFVLSIYLLSVQNISEMIKTDGIYKI